MHTVALLRPPTLAMHRPNSRSRPFAPQQSSTYAPPKWTLDPVTPETTDEAVDFINQARQDMFPTLHKQLADDVARLVQSGYFLLARDRSNGQVIGTIGYVPYDHRFPQLNYDDIRTVEVVRLYVLPSWRRTGLGATLFEALKRHALEERVVCLYLHTHPFLPGAVEFWEKKGFSIVYVEEDAVWRTTHMQMMLAE